MTETFPQAPQRPKEPDKPGEIGIQLMQKSLREWQDNYLQLARLLSTYDAMIRPHNFDLLKFKPLLQRFAKETFRAAEEAPTFIDRASDPRADLDGSFKEYFEKEGITTNWGEVEQVRALESHFLKAGFRLVHRFGDLRRIYGVADILQLAAWTRSRRVFSLDEETTSLLRKLNYGTWRLDELLHPFADYFIELKNQPLTYTVSEGASKGMTVGISGILVSHTAPKILRKIIARQAVQEPEFASVLASSHVVSITIFPTSPGYAVGARPLLEDRERKDIKRLMEMNPEGRNRMLNKTGDSVDLTTGYGMGCGWTFFVPLDTPIADYEGDELEREVLKICAGLAMYMTMTPVSKDDKNKPETNQGMRDIQGTEWKKKGVDSKKKVTPQKLFADGTNIFSIERVIAMTTNKGSGNTVAWRDLSGMQKSAHAVMSYLRRARGKGSDPDAPRDQKVRGHWKNLGAGIPAGAVGHKVK